MAAGGHVFWNGGHRVMGVLSMSRALGDRYLKQFGVIATPEVRAGQGCLCLVIAKLVRRRMQRRTDGHTRLPQMRIDAC